MRSIVQIASVAHPIDGTSFTQFVMMASFERSVAKFGIESTPFQKANGCRSALEGRPKLQ
jgi:hypothetical protein